MSVVFGIWNVQSCARKKKEENSMTINSILRSAIWGQVNVLLMSLLFITMSSSGKGEHKTKGRRSIITDSSRVLKFSFWLIFDLFVTNEPCLSIFQLGSWLYLIYDWLLRWKLWLFIFLRDFPIKRSQTAHKKAKRRRTRHGKYLWWNEGEKI